MDLSLLQNSSQRLGCHCAIEDIAITLRRKGAFLLQGIQNPTLTQQRPS
jgi:hypothetical protein